MRLVSLGSEALRLACLLNLASAALPGLAHAQGGPPFLTNDTGTPGNGHWEINLAVAQSASTYQIPSIDLNFGLGDRIQLTYEVPYVIQTSSDQPRQSGWSNALPGVKWRFFDHGAEGWQLSTFPQIETAASTRAQERGIASPGPRLLLPIEATKKVGAFDLDVEAGYYIPKNGPREQILGLVIGRTLTQRLELDTEIYNDRATGAPPHETTMDVGGRYALAQSFVALFMAGRSIGGTDNGRPDVIGYLGIQILLGN
jgi:hypothetical protein